MKEWRCHDCNVWIQSETPEGAKAKHATGHRIDGQPRFPETPSDLVNAPPHYTSGAIECIDALQSALTPEEFQGFLRGNVLKYLWRCNLKGGNQDLNKASWYLDRLIKIRKDD